MFRRTDAFNKGIVIYEANQLEGDIKTTKGNRKHT